MRRPSVFVPLHKGDDRGSVLSDMKPPPLKPSAQRPLLGKEGKSN